MEPYLLSTELIKISPIDSFESMIWNDNFCGFGDFELVASAKTDIIAKCLEDRYLIIDDSDHVMIIEGLEIKTNSENDDLVIVKGRSLESILERRIVWNQTVLIGNLQTSVQQLLNENAISPTDSSRDISRLIFEASTDPLITALTVATQFFGETLYEAITNICLSKNIGYKITLNDNGQFVFKLYTGVDRSYDQILNPYVVFSPEYDNLLSSDYHQNKATLRTVSLVAGETGVENERYAITVNWDEGAGIDLARREMFTDASSVNRNLPDDQVLTDEEYDLQLAQKGLEELAKNKFVKEFNGEVDSTILYVFGEDFFMGDILQVVDKYAHETKSQVIGLIRSIDHAGIKTIPTFRTIT